MRVVIPGGTGQIGTLLARSFHADGHEVVALARHPRRAPWRVVAWDGRPRPLPAMEGAVSANVRVRLGEPVHGWLDVDILADGGEARFTASAMYASLEQLVSALHGCLRTPGEYVAVWNCEPMEYETRFRRDESGAVTLAVHVFPDCHGSALRADVSLLSAEGQYANTALPFWRALRGLRARHPAADWTARWGRPFPDAELDRLTDALHEAGVLHGA